MANASKDTFVKAEDSREGVYINGVLILESQNVITAQARRGSGVRSVRL